MINRFVLTLLATLALTMLACNPPVKEPERSGFISDYSKLELLEDESVELTEDEAYVYIGDRLKNYRQFLIDEVVMLYSTDPDDPKFEPEELSELLNHARQKMEETLTEESDYNLATEPGRGVARIRIAITNVEATIGALNLSSFTKVTGAGLGGAAVEGEIVDSLSGEQLAATMRWGGGSRFGRAGYTKTGDAKIILTRWATGFRKNLDKLNGISD